MCKEDTLMTKCPVCNNTQGFAVGTCCNCGYNHISCKFERIEVYVDDLRLAGVNDAIINRLIDKHHQTFRSFRNYDDEQT